MVLAINLRQSGSIIKPYSQKSELQSQEDSPVRWPAHTKCTTELTDDNWAVKI